MVFLGASLCFGFFLFSLFLILFLLLPLLLHAHAHTARSLSLVIQPHISHTSLSAFLPTFFSVVAKLPDDHRMQLGRLFANIQQILTDPWDEDEDNSNANADTDKHKHKHKQKGRQHEQGEEEDEADAEGEDEEDEGGEEKEGKQSRRESDDGARSTQSARRLLGLGNEEEDARSEITLLLQFAKEEVGEKERESDLC